MNVFERDSKVRVHFRPAADASYQERTLRASCRVLNAYFNANKSEQEPLSPQAASRQMTVLCFFFETEVEHFCSSKVEMASRASSFYSSLREGRARGRRTRCEQNSPLLPQIRPPVVRPAAASYAPTSPPPRTPPAQRHAAASASSPLELFPHV